MVRVCIKNGKTAPKIIENCKSADDFNKNRNLYQSVFRDFIRSITVIAVAGSHVQIVFLSIKSSVYFFTNNELALIDKSWKCSVFCLGRRLYMYSSKSQPNINRKSQAPPPQEKTVKGTLPWIDKKV